MVKISCEFYLIKNLALRPFKPKFDQILIFMIIFATLIILALLGIFLDLFYCNIFLVVFQKNYGFIVQQNSAQPIIQNDDVTPNPDSSDYAAPGQLMASSAGNNAWMWMIRLELKRIFGDNKEQAH